MILARMPGYSLASRRWQDATKGCFLTWGFPQAIHKVSSPRDECQVGINIPTTLPILSECGGVLPEGLNLQHQSSLKSFPKAEKQQRSGEQIFHFLEGQENE